MHPEYIEVNSSQPIIKNTLPLVYDSETNWSYLDKTYIRASLTEQKLSLELKYISLTKRNEVIGVLSFKTTFHIYSSHTKFRYFIVLHQCIVKQIEDFTELVKECGLINYPLNKIHIPSFSQDLVILRGLYGPE